MAPSSTTKSTDANSGNKFEDLSGVAIKPGDNPYDALINACQGSQAKLQALYATHRTTRNAQQRDKFLTSEFNGLNIDQVLLRLENPDLEPGFKDPRDCLVAHSRTAEEIASLVSSMRPAIPALTGLTFTRRSRLVKPMISYDLSAVAVSFLPAAGEEVLSPPLVPAPSGDTPHADDDNYTYHHLRRDVFNKASETVAIASRYVVPSAHITLGRYLSQKDHETPELRERWIQAIEDINKWLEKEVWEVKDGEFIGEWIVGQERGLDARCGKLWYGGGRTIMTGEGF
ncbi:hypothetical protein NEMBOFW57_008692 [Staphylotrichum longicolle]|uniref:Uncharacterized protein n=1 Tax=Staphylotrichum longicolle TaxID=669026 RepID=A0AAD4HZ52_9PEZI|nr:hypothetical protein NEMBOFW57_008692 [Staphylotrichum longicolle]